MKEVRFSLYSLLLLIFAYMVTLTFYNLTWTTTTNGPNAGVNYSERRKSSVRNGSSSVDPKRQRAKEQDQREATRTVASTGFGGESHAHVVTKEKSNHASQQKEAFKNPPTPLSLDPQSLLDFAVVDFDDDIVTDAVTAWLSGHPRIRMLSSLSSSSAQDKGSEMDAATIQSNNPFHLLLDEEFQGNIMDQNDPYHNDDQKRIICGHRVNLNDDNELDALRNFWPKTKLIVVLRHPIRWFEDFYNRFILDIETTTSTTNAMLLSPNLLIGSCRERLHQKVCTEKADMAFPLLKLGKTMANKKQNLTPRTLEVIQENHLRQNLSEAKIPLHPNPVFLVTWEQLTNDHDSNPDRQKQLIDDLEYFLGIRSGIPFLQLPLFLDQNDLLSKRREKEDHSIIPKMDICDVNFRPLRKALMDVSRRSTQWIRDDFLATTTVTCSQMDWFTGIMLSWMQDPCGPNRRLGGPA